MSKEQGKMSANDRRIIIPMKSVLRAMAFERRQYWPVLNFEGQGLRGVIFND